MSINKLLALIFDEDDKIVPKPENTMKLTADKIKIATEEGVGEIRGPHSGYYYVAVNVDEDKLPQGTTGGWGSGSSSGLKMWAERALKGLDVHVSTASANRSEWRDGKARYLPPQIGLSAKESENLEAALQKLAPFRA